MLGRRDDPVSTLKESPESGAGLEVTFAGSPRGFALPGARSRAVEEVLRRALDIVVGSAMLVVSAPLMLAIAAVIKLDSPGPVLFCQQRIGMNRRRRSARPRSDRRRQELHGRPFGFYKFRTMYVDARERFPDLYAYSYDRDELGSLPIKVLMCKKDDTHRFHGCTKPERTFDDPRVTRVGRWLRQTSLDELPNLINVVLGDMHLVGPRPDIPDNMKYYAEHHIAKLDVRPGVTGLAQIRGRGRLSFNEINDYDVEYVARRSMLLDLKILLGTIPSLVTGRGAY